MTTPPELEGHPHARAVLAPVLESAAEPSHAYIFHGPSGVGKRTLARTFAAELLAAGAVDPDDVRRRALSGVHPDLTWVTPSGAHELLRADIDGPVVSAASRTPFEGRRSVFVIEGAEKMNDEAANRLLKTLEEPPGYVVLILIADNLAAVLPTVLSRCQQVRFEPRPEQETERRLVASGVDAELARALTRLSLGSGERARELAGIQGGELRTAAERYVHAVVAGRTDGAPWQAMLTCAKQAGETAAAEVEGRAEELLELVPRKDRKRLENELSAAGKRARRRAESTTFELALDLVAATFRDLAVAGLGAGEVVLASDRQQTAAELSDGLSTGSLLAAVEAVEQVRQSLALNVSAELALEALAYRLERELPVAGSVPTTRYGR